MEGELGRDIDCSAERIDAASRRGVFDSSDGVRNDLGTAAGTSGETRVGTMVTGGRRMGGWAEEERERRRCTLPNPTVALSLCMCV